MNIVLRFCIAYILLAFAIPTEGLAASYPTCKRTQVNGKVFALTTKTDKNNREYRCWKNVVNGDVLNAEDLDGKDGSFQFTYIFPDQENDDYDQLFSVLVREVRRDNEESDPYLAILRERMRTLCSRKADRQNVPREWKKFSADFPGLKYNEAHKPDGIRGRLAEFHVAFVNAQRRCVRTDDVDHGRRKSFYIDGVKFPDVPEIRFLARLYDVFKQDAARAFGKSKYKKYRVRIRQGKKSATGMLSASFFVRDDVESHVQIQDLTNKRVGQPQLLKPFNFKVR